jgi:hypothetical protein
MISLRKLSRPITELKPEYDVTLLGGYGGSIAASSFSHYGKVCLLKKVKFQ